MDTAAAPHTTDRTSTARSTAAGTAWWWWFALTSLAITVLAVGPYLTTSLHQLAADDHGVAANYVHRPPVFQVALYVHATSAGVALVLSPLQLSQRLRGTRPRLHRAVGRAALSAVAGLAGLVLSSVNEAGLVGVLGFGGLSLCWLGCAAAAYRTARARRFAAHQLWAVRVFALTYAGVTLRLQTLLFVAVQVALGHPADEAFDRAYAVVTFSSWVPDLIIAEWLLRRGRR